MTLAPPTYDTLSVSTAPWILHAPREILDGIIRHLAPASLSSLASTCHFLHRYITSHDSLWRREHALRFPLAPPPTEMGMALKRIRGEALHAGRWARPDVATLVWQAREGTNIAHVSAFPRHWRIFTTDGRITLYPRDDHSGVNPPFHLDTYILGAQIIGDYIVGGAGNNSLSILPLPRAFCAPVPRTSSSPDTSWAPASQTISDDGSFIPVFLNRLHPASPPSSPPDVACDADAKDGRFFLTPPSDTGMGSPRMTLAGGHLLTLAGWDDVCIWNLRTREKIYEGHRVCHCSPSADGRYIAIVPSDRLTLRILRRLPAGGTKVMAVYAAPCKIEAATWLHLPGHITLYGRHPETWADVLVLPDSTALLPKSPISLSPIRSIRLGPHQLPLRVCPVEGVFITTPLDAFAETVHSHALLQPLPPATFTFERGTFSIHILQGATLLSLRHHRVRLHSLWGGLLRHDLYTLDHRIGSPGSLSTAGDANGFALWRPNGDALQLVDLPLV